MKNRNFSLLILLLVISSLLAGTLGFMGKDHVYAAYDFDWKTQTFTSLPLKGMQEGESLFAALQQETETADEAGADDTADAASSKNDPEEDPADTADASGTEDTAEPEEKPLVTVEKPVKEETPEEVPEEEPEAEETTQPGEVAPDAGAEATDEVPPQEEPVPDDGAVPAAISGAPAEDSYYADALFIGDSRTVGLSQYVPGLDQHATFYCAVSLSVFNALSAQIANVDGIAMNVDSALQKKQFGKIYIMVGINEIGYERNAWLETYRGVIARIRELQPAAVIYIQSIMHVSSGKEAANPVFNNAEVNARNEGLKTIANGADILYIDINYLIDDANGALRADLTFDGVHLTAGAYDLWYQEIRAQTR